MGANRQLIQPSESFALAYYDGAPSALLTTECCAECQLTGGHILPAHLNPQPIHDEDLQ